MRYTIPAYTLHRGLSATLPAASSDFTRPHLHGVQFAQTDKGACLTATDGHMLAHYRFESIDGVIASDEGCSAGHRTDAILPIATVQALIKAIKPPSKSTSIEGPPVVLDLDACTATFPGGSLTWVHVDAKFPPYDQVIPSKTEIGGCPVRGIGVKLLARAGQCVTASHAGGGTKLDGMIVTTYADPLDPVRIDNQDGRLVVVLMPFRCDASDTWKKLTDARARDERAAAKKGTVKAA